MNPFQCNFSMYMYIYMCIYIHPYIYFVQDIAFENFPYVSVEWVSFASGFVFCWLPVRCNAICWTTTVISSVGSLGTTISEIWIQLIQTSFKGKKPRSTPHQMQYSVLGACSGNLLEICVCIWIRPNLTDHADQRKTIMIEPAKLLNALRSNNKSPHSTYHTSTLTNERAKVSNSRYNGKSINSAFYVVAKTLVSTEWESLSRPSICSHLQSIHHSTDNGRSPRNGTMMPG